MHGKESAQSPVMETLAFILPIIAACSVLLMFGIMLYFKIRRTLPVRVNCWFCNKDTQVPYGNQNCWDCPSCDQYNGFLPDGSYNKAIPAQHDELLNHPVLAVPVSLLTEGKGNGLCRKCNINQELKVQQLASFSPVNPARYEEEVEEFREHLERNYQLCSLCEKVLKQTLHKQKSWLLGLRMQQIRGSGVMSNRGVAVALRNLRQLYADGIRGITCVLAAWLTLSASSGKLPELAFPGSEAILPLASVYDTYISAFSATIQLLVLFSNKQAPIDIISTSLWAILHGQSWIKKWEKLEDYISLLHFIKIYMVTSLLNFILCLYAFLMPQQRKQMKVMSTDSSINSSGSTFNISNESDCDCVPEDAVTTEKQEEAVKLPEHSDAKILTKFRESCASDCSSSSSSAVSTSMTTQNDSPLDINLDCLSLDDCKRKSTKKAQCSLFQTKVYGLNNSLDLFSRREKNAEQSSRKPSLLRPSQLNVQNHVTQSSWVAGGYWQSPKYRISHTGVSNVALPMCWKSSPLSRSSSQSSGFVSQSSQLPTGSLCGGECEPGYHYPSFCAPHRPAYGLNMMPPSPPLLTGFCSPLPPQTILQPNYYYPFFTSPPLSPIWNTAAFLPSRPLKLSANVTSYCRSRRSSSSLDGSNKTNLHTPVSRKSQTLAGALKDNAFLTVCFYSSVILSALVAVCAALMNTQLSLIGLV